MAQRSARQASRSSDSASDRDAVSTLLSGYSLPKPSPDGRARQYKTATHELAKISRSPGSVSVDYVASLCAFIDAVAVGKRVSELWQLTKLGHLFTPEAS